MGEDYSKITSLICRLLFYHDGIERGHNFTHTITRSPGSPDILTKDLFILGHVNAVKPVMHHKTFDPLNVWSHVIKYFSPLDHSFEEFLGGVLLNPWNKPFYQKGFHGVGLPSRNTDCQNLYRRYLSN